KICATNGQTRATPLLLHYENGDFNCLHQDVYGAVAFPFQMTCFLSQPGADYEGGEFVIVEQQPRAQSKAEVITAQLGQVLIFATRYRPVKGSRGFYRTSLRHGVSRLKRGIRFTLGVIYHDSQ
ncbi:MAG TPA: 2OG-Fe(II) oxygenase, partial [Candidatus Acidoferrum sp.]|nr:2OG-Fe(II) oxygenase [Candidatus Acidoferrum sp.]